MYRITCASRAAVDGHTPAQPRQPWAVEPDNRPLSDRFTGRSLFREIERQLAHGSREPWLVDDDVGPGRSDDDVAVNDDSPYRCG
jgi:hypothetical protein